MNSRDALLDAVESGPPTREIAERMREIRHRNHFGPDIEKALRRSF